MNNFQISATDLLGGICFDAMRIVASTQQAAQGAAFPDPKQLRELIEIMLKKAQLIEQSAATQMGAKAEMRAELN